MRMLWPIKSETQDSEYPHSGNQSFPSLRYSEDALLHHPGLVPFEKHSGEYLVPAAAVDSIILLSSTTEGVP